MTAEDSNVTPVSLVSHVLKKSQKTKTKNTNHDRFVSFGDTQLKYTEKQTVHVEGFPYLCASGTGQ